VPDLRTVVLPDEGLVSAHDIEAIDVAVFSADLWLEGRGAPFMKVALQAPALQWLHMFSAGLDDPVFDRFRDRGVKVTHSAGSSATPIAHTVLMQLIAMCRATRPLAIAQSEREWVDVDVIDVEGRTVGIVGFGAIGAEVARLAQAFGMHPIGLRRSPRGDEGCPVWNIDRLHELLGTVDDLVLCASLNTSSHGMIGRAELALLKPGAHIVNVGRGQLVDESALVEALTSGRVGAAALDVFSREPLPSDSPLWDLPNVIVTPHTAGATPLAAERAAHAFLRNLRRWAKGEQLLNLG
jgi:phosphoglycerate dehydrogenase-like enzyme